MAEGLGRLIQANLHDSKLKGLSFHESPPMAYQQFVDDNLLFGHPSVHEARSIKRILKTFSEASGTTINLEKSQIYFFNMDVVTKRNIARILGFSTSSLPTKYLGAPLTDSAIKHSSWHHLLDKLERKISSWTFRTLNLPSCLTLLKSVLQAMPIYLFSILAAPKWVLKCIRKIHRTFLWAGDNNHRKWPLVKWSTTCQPKREGGLGLRDPETSNEIMSAKIWWGWISRNASQWSKLWNLKYAPC